MAWSVGGGAKAAPEDAMLSWIKEKGGESHVIIASRAGGARGTYATRTIKRDDVIARIPLQCGVWFPADYSDFAELGVIVAKEALRDDGPHAPYLRALPMLGSHLHTASFETFPAEYLHLIQSDTMVQHITSTQSGTLNFWASHGVQLLQEGVTLEKLRAALVTIATRYFGITHRGVSTSILIPLLDFANHFDNCTNYYEYRPCNFSEEEASKAGGKDDDRWQADAADRDHLCTFWKAGSDIKEGDQVCNRYGYIAPDQAYFQYGFNLPDEPPRLSRVDEPTFTAEYIYGALAHEEPVEFEGTLDELEEELSRIQGRIKQLEEVGKVEATTKAAASDPDGQILAGIKFLRQQRLTAMRSEVERLEEQIKLKIEHPEEPSEAGDEAAGAVEAGEGEGDEDWRLAGDGAGEL